MSIVSNDHICHCSYLAPVITTETTNTIEDLIIQRIRDKAFDDVERKQRTNQADNLPAYKKEILLEHEKSKMSLAQIYEQEYVKKQSVRFNKNIRRRRQTQCCSYD
jgi:U3 small nucleolar RNA-associated protein MPP10